MLGGSSVGLWTILSMRIVSSTGWPPTDVRWIVMLAGLSISAGGAGGAGSSHVLVHGGHGSSVHIGHTCSQGMVISCGSSSFNVSLMAEAVINRKARVSRFLQIIFSLFFDFNSADQSSLI